MLYEAPLVVQILAEYSLHPQRIRKEPPKQGIKVGKRMGKVRKYSSNLPDVGILHPNIGFLNPYIFV